MTIETPTPTPTCCGLEGDPVASRPADPAWMRDLDNTVGFEAEPESMFASLVASSQPAVAASDAWDVPSVLTGQGSAATSFRALAADGGTWADWPGPGRLEAIGWEYPFGGYTELRDPTVPPWLGLPDGGPGDGPGGPEGPPSWMDHSFGEEGSFRGFGGARPCLPPADGSPLMRTPALTEMRPETQGCFTTPGWGEDDCCPPPLALGACEPPNLIELLAVGPLDIRPWNQSPDKNLDPPPAGRPDIWDIALYTSAMSLLQQNLDILRWVLCLVETYSPDFDRLDRELSDCVVGLIENNQLTFTFAGPDTNPFAFSYDKPAIDGSVGVIQPVQDRYEAKVADYRSGGVEAFCAIAATAVLILHEVVHICGDDGCWKEETGDAGGGGACHHAELGVPAFCWDEARMADSAFQWALVQRYPCLATAPCCVGFGIGADFLSSQYTQPYAC